MANVFMNYQGIGCYVDEDDVEEFNVSVEKVSDYSSEENKYWVSLNNSGCYIETEDSIEESDISFN